MLIAGGLLAGTTVIGLLPTTAGASSHREAPLIAADPAVDNTDVYAFSSPENDANVAIVANWVPFEEPNGGPNFYPWSDDAEYLVNIDNDGDALADLVYRWRFTTDDRRSTDTFLYNNGPVDSLTDDNLLFRQSFTLDVSTDGGTTYGAPIATGPVAPSYTGPGSMGTSQDYVDNLRTPAITTLPGGGRTLTTQAEDSFFLDLRVFDLLYGGDLSETGQDTLAGYNVNSIVLELPKSEVAIDNDAAGNPVIGVWSTTTRPTLRNADGTAAAGAGSTQVSRLGQPLVNEVVVPTGLKDAFNSISPDQDAAAAGGAVVQRVLDPEVPKLVEGIYGVPAPKAPRYDIFETFLTGIVSTAKHDVDGDAATANPIDVDLNSQVLNAGADPAAFQPSEMLRLNMSITEPTGLDGQPLAQASRLGVVGGDIQGFPNGRRLADDVVDIELLALEGVFDVSKVTPADPASALAAGDGVDSNDNAFSGTFPYIAGPNTQAVNKGGGTGAGGTDLPTGNGNPVTPPAAMAPPAAAPSAGAPAAAAPQGSANGYPVGGVETGEGGLTHTLIPALTGGAAMLLIGAGAGSLLRSRSLRRRAAGPGTLA
jgi:hypothetical protein